MLLRDAVVFEFQTLLNLNVAVSKVNTCLVASKFAFRLVTSLEIDEVIATSFFDGLTLQRPHLSIKGDIIATSIIHKQTLAVGKGIIKMFS